MKALALDVGSKRVGIAVCDETGVAIRPLPALVRAGISKDAVQIAHLLVQEGVSALIVGLPLELSGAEGPRAARVRKLVQAIETPVPIHWQDERFSTQEALRISKASGVKGKRRKQDIDSQSAVVILKAWLETNRKPD